MQATSFGRCSFRAELRGIAKQRVFPIPLLNELRYRQRSCLVASPVGLATTQLNYKAKLYPFGSFFIPSGDTPFGQPKGKVVAPLVLPFGSLLCGSPLGQPKGQHIVALCPLYGSTSFPSGCPLGVSLHPRSLPPLVRFAVPPLGGKGWGNKGLYPLRFAQKAKALPLCFALALPLPPPGVRHSLSSLRGNAKQRGNVRALCSSSVAPKGQRSEPEGIKKRQLSPYGGTNTRPLGNLERSLTELSYVQGCPKSTIKTTYYVPRGTSQKVVYKCYFYFTAFISLF